MTVSTISKHIVFLMHAGSAEDIIGALSLYSWDIIQLVVVLPRDVVATESSTVKSRADVVVDAAGHACRVYCQNYTVTH